MATARGTSRKFSGKPRPTTKRFLWLIRQLAPSITADAPWTCALYDLKTGKEVKMPSGYDEMTDRAFAEYAGGTPEERARRALLRQAMEKQDFQVNPEEWWHFDCKDWKQYPILNVKFEDLGQ
jgi:D-alanyl-D-alanine dipeptidase